MFNLTMSNNSLKIQKSGLASGTAQTDKEILRAAIIAELDAINLYEQFSNKTSDENLKKVLLDIADEEKVHVGEFEKLLDMLDNSHEESIEAGKEETEDLIDNKNS